jgi:hypothetical protein
MLGTVMNDVRLDGMPSNGMPEALECQTFDESNLIPTPTYSDTTAIGADIGSTDRTDFGGAALTSVCPRPARRSITDGLLQRDESPDESV